MNDIEYQQKIHETLEVAYGIDLTNLTPEEENEFCGECGEHFIDCFCYVEVS